MARKKAPPRCEICGWDEATADVEYRPEDVHEGLGGKYRVCDSCRLFYYPDRPFKPLRD